MAHVITLTFYKQGVQLSTWSCKREISSGSLDRGLTAASSLLGVHSKSALEKETDEIVVEIAAFLASWENNYNKEILFTSETGRDL